VDSNIAPDYPYFVSFSRLHGVTSRLHQRSPVEAPLILPVGPALAAIGLLSLGLWGAIWLAAYSLAWL
jgi:hypothetical protein